MIYCLFGENTYQSRQKLNEIIKEYRKKTDPGFRIHRFDAEEDDVSELKNVIQSQSLFSSKKLIVIFSACSRKESFSILQQFVDVLKDAKDTTLIVWEGGLNREAEKRLQEIKPSFVKSQEFRALSQPALLSWIREEARARGAILNEYDVSYLVSLGSNLWKISGELEKIALRSEEATQQTVLQHATVFHLADTFLTAPRLALQYFFTLLRGGEEEARLFSYLASHMRTLVMVKSYMNQGKTVLSSHGIHPYVVKKASVATRDISFPNLVSFFRSFFEEDCKIKTGLSRHKESMIKILLTRGANDI